MNRGEGWEPYPEAATLFRESAEGAMADTPEKKTSKASVEASLANKLLIMSMMPPGVREQTLEGYANKALPHGSEQERNEFKRYWRAQLHREREHSDREREERSEREAEQQLRMLESNTVKPHKDLEGDGSEPLHERLSAHGSDREPPVQPKSPKKFVDSVKRLQPRSYEKLASTIGISKDTLYAITKESRWVTDDKYEQVAKFCKCTVEDLHPRDLPRPQRRRS